MREIIFRGKRVDNGEWVYGCLVNNLWVKSELTDSPGVATVEIIARLNDYECWEDLADCGNIIEVIPETVGQYTGLKDKNGKMIFEGDIVSHATETEMTKRCTMVGHDEVKWLQCQSKFVLGDGHPWGMIYKAYKIHGNIHDNPEYSK